jgi:hypothetical protein
MRFARGVDENARVGVRKLFDNYAVMISHCAATMRQDAQMCSPRQFGENLRLLGEKKWCESVVGCGTRLGGGGRM